MIHVPEINEILVYSSVFYICMCLCQVLYPLYAMKHTDTYCYLV